MKNPFKKNNMISIKCEVVTCEHKITSLKDLFIHSAYHIEEEIRTEKQIDLLRDANQTLPDLVRPNYIG